MYTPRYCQYPKASETYNKSELRLIAKESGRDIANINSWKGYQLGDFVDRIQGGHRLYYDHTLNDLKDELAERSIDLPERQAPINKATLISLLDNADDARTFEQFLELPAELRSRIYTFAFSYPDNAHRLQQPAISRTCRLVRKESLPVFYETNRFGFLIDRVASGYGVRQHVLENWPIFVKNRYIAMMRHFELTLLSQQTRVRVKVNLPSEDGKHGLTIKVWSVFPEVRMTKSTMEECQKSVENQMRPRIEALLKGTGLGNFTTREVLQLALAVHKPVKPTLKFKDVIV